MSLEMDPVVSPEAGAEASARARPAPARLAVRWRLVLREAARQSRWHDPLLAVGLGVLCLLYQGAPLLPGGKPGLDVWLAPLAYNILQFGVPLVLALRIADAAVAVGGARPRWAYGPVVPLVVGSGVWVVGPALMPLLGSDPGWTFSNDLWLAAGVGVLFALIVTGHARWRGGERLLARARAADSARAAQAQQVQAARLLALQARVEPQLLFDALGRVAERMPDDARGADALLADTIALLRALLPQERGDSSTLARELELLRLRGRVTGEAALRPDRLRFEVGPTLADAALAPGLLVDILRTLGVAPLRWRVEATAQAAATRLLIAVQAEPASQPEAGADAGRSSHLRRALAALDADALCIRLRAVHGDSARLEIDADASRLLIDLPLHIASPQP